MEEQHLPYIKILPDIRLRRFVECYWCVKHTSAGADFRPVLPDGCSDILFNFSTPIFYRKGAEVSCNVFPSFYVGIQTMPILTKGTGATDVFGIRFKGFGAWRFLQRPLKEFNNQVVSLDDLGEIAFAQLSDKLVSLSLLERVTLIELHLLSRLANQPACDLVDQFFNDPCLPIHSFCQLNKISERTLERRSLERVGLSPKMYQRIVRFRKASQQLPLFNGSLMEFAWDMGYYDHAHLTKEFREFGHFLPSSLTL